MSDTGWKSPGTVVNDDTVGTVAWTNPEGAKALDEEVTYVVWSMGSPHMSLLKLLVGGSITGENRSDGENFYNSEEEEDFVYGAADDVWGATLTPSSVNSSDFGVVLQVIERDIEIEDSEYLKATNFGFEIPSGAEIDGVEVMFTAGGSTGEQIRINHIQIKVYYTDNSTPVVGQKYALPPFRRS